MTWARATAARLAAPPSLFFALDLCLEEALSNAIKYGFGDPPPADAQLHLSVAREQTALRVTIEDTGVAFDPSAAPEPELAHDIESARVGGLGIHLMRNFTKAMRYDRPGDRNRLTLWFAIEPA
jgi:anti-sigma regulatory factor (Ser/Thr protein kinase)